MVVINFDINEDLLEEALNFNKWCNENQCNECKEKHGVVSLNDTLNQYIADGMEYCTKDCYYEDMEE
jgi:hypothetical protein